MVSSPLVLPAQVKDCTQEWLDFRPAPLPNGPFSTQDYHGGLAMVHVMCNRGFYGATLAPSHLLVLHLRGKIFAVSSWNQYQGLTPGDCQTFTWELIYGGSNKSIYGIAALFLSQGILCSNLKQNIYHHLKMGSV